MKISRIGLGVLSSALIALALACSGGSDSNDTAANAPSASNISEQSQVNFTESAAKLQELTSFRFDFSMTLDLGGLGSGSGTAGEDPFADALAMAFLGLLGGIEAEGAYVAPDKVEVRLTLAGQEMGYVQIGDDAWMNDGAGWQATQAGESLDFSQSPADLLSDFLPQQVLQAAETSSETVNGVETTRYSFDREALAQLSEDMGEPAGLEDISEANLDIWLTEGSVPVKLLVNMAGQDETGQSLSLQLDANVRDINSSSIEIEAPI